jgi:hypothetical protein
VRAQQQIVTVARLSQHIARRQHPTGTRLVLNNYVLAKQGREPVGDKPGRNVGRAAGAEPDDETDRPRRIRITGERHSGDDERGDKTNKDFESIAHGMNHDPSQ